MVKTILLLLLIVFSVTGICEFVYIIRMFFFLPKKRFDSYAFVVLEKECAVKQITFLWQKIRWNGDSFAHGIIAVTDNLDTKEIMLCREYIKNKNNCLCSLNGISKDINLQGENLNA